MSKKNKLIVISILVMFSIIFVNKKNIKSESIIDRNRVVYYMNNDNIKSYAWFNLENNEYYLFINNKDIENSNYGFYVSSEIVDGDRLEKSFKISADRIELQDSYYGLIIVNICPVNLDRIYIDLNGVALKDVFEDKEKKYPNNPIHIYEENNNILNEEVEFKGRGNSSWLLFDKKGYQIKFNKKTKVFGMSKAKKWVLIPSASDGTLLKNYLMFNLSKEISMINYIDSHYIDLWINGDYQGVYLISEKIELGDNRIEENNDNAVLFEWDFAYATQEDIWFKYDNWENCNFAVKDANSDSEDIINESIDAFINKLDELDSYINKTNNEISIEELNKFINVDSFAKYYLLHEYAWNADGECSNFYWYIDSEKNRIDLGPVWDFDNCMNSYGDDCYSSNYGISNAIYKRLLSIDCFNQYVNRTYLEYEREFKSLSNKLIDYSKQIEISADANFIRWNYFGKENPKGGKYKNSYKEEIESLANWLNKRKENFYINKYCHFNISEDDKYIRIEINDIDQSEKKKLYIWSIENGQDDLQLYNLIKQQNGSYSCQILKNNFNNCGMLMMHLYNDNNYSCHHYYNLKYLTPTPELIVINNEKENTLEITLKNAEDCKTVHFPVWSLENSQDDLKWYKAKKENDGNWTCTVNLADHKSTGVYAVHAYETSQGNQMLCYTSILVKQNVKTTPELIVINNEKENTLEITLKNAEDCKTVHFPVWSLENSQDDLKWYKAKKENDGNWTCTVNLADHKSTGVYAVHAYETSQGNQMLCYTSILVNNNKYKSY